MQLNRSWMFVATLKFRKCHCTFVYMMHRSLPRAEYNEMDPNKAVAYHVTQFKIVSVGCAGLAKNSPWRSHISLVGARGMPPAPKLR